MSAKEKDPLVHVCRRMHTLPRDTATHPQYRVYRNGELVDTTCNTRVVLPDKNNYHSLTMRRSVFDVIQQITDIELAKEVSEFLKQNEELVRKGIITGDDIKAVIAVSE